MTAVTTLDDVLDDLRANATGIRDKGTAFENLTLEFFRTNPLHQSEFATVQTFADWAPQGGKRDTGIDLVATRHDGGITAIQCKFYDEGHTVQKSDIDSFFTASGKKPFTERIIVSTTDKWSDNAEAALENQHLDTTRFGLDDMRTSPVEWAILKNLTEAPKLKKRKPKQLRPHQRAAIDDVVAGFATSARGKLIMACGTGKTFTSLKLAEEMVKPGGSVLFLVPSISLLSQSLKEWGAEREAEMRFFAVCSDTHVGRTRKQKELHEDISAHDLEIPATTKSEKLVDGASATSKGAITVVFATYQSIDVVSAAQRAGLPDFDLIICDEAHRTTGVTLTGEGDKESAFVKVHDNANVAAKRRVYMTATPRVYGEDAKKKAVEGAAVLASMDDEEVFGPEFHRLGFGEAVDAGLLADYKVLILSVVEDYVAHALQTVLASDGNEIDLTNAAKLVGCWNALAKRGDVEQYGDDPGAMRRAVAFSQTIKASKGVTAAFEELSDALVGAAADGTRLSVEANHVDGTQNALYRNEQLAWLKAEAPDDSTCRILSNARCLSEGVDVPALDAVLFLNPRNSIVDVVQSVGRVMRKSEGKKFGYVIIPVAVPSGLEPHEALDKTDRYKVVWEVLRALRSHDERLEATVNTLDPTKPNDRIIPVNIGAGGSGSDRNDDTPDGTPVETQGSLDLRDSPVWREAIFARLVKKVGQRMYWDRWGKEVADAVARTTSRINAILARDKAAQREFDTFLEGIRRNLNDSISRDDAVSMLAQHLVTEPVFNAVFREFEFVEHNTVARTMQNMLDVLNQKNLETEGSELDEFYKAVRTRLDGVDDAGRMQFVNELYEKFFKRAFPTVAGQLGIVYTPVEIVDFIIRSVEHVLNEEFDASLSDKGVHVLDPFTGTGTFIVRLLQSGLIKPEDLLYKYTHELHCNEILLLAYYIAVVNVEATFHSLRGGEYVPFEGAVLADTFQMTEDGDTLDGDVFTANSERMKQQRELDIRVIVGNPPYSVGQGSQNDGAANLKYPTLDRAIETTYAAQSSATNKNSLYDSYVRAIRWASDRIKDDGVIGFVTNGGFIDGNTADGIRKSLAGEFSEIYVFNLRGNARTAGVQRQKEKGNVFAEGGRTTIAVTFLVKRSATRSTARIKYRDIGDYLTTDQKLEIIKSSEVDSIEWEVIEPNGSGDWLNQRNPEFDAFTPIGSKDDPNRAIFAVHSGGLKTNRDAWVYNSSRAVVEANVRGMVGFYNSHVDKFAAQSGDPGAKTVERLIDLDPTHFSWNRADKTHLARGRKYVVRDDAFRVGGYRPFHKQRVCFDRNLNDMVYRLPSLFPPGSENLGFYLDGTHAENHGVVLAISEVPCLDLFGRGGQFFPRYSYAEKPADDLFAAASDETYTRVDNITDEALADYRAKYGPEVSKDDIFYYVYGLLHSPDYRTKYAADLKRMLPRIPMVAPADDFRAFADAGRKLADLHIGYETVEPWPLHVAGEPASSVKGDALYDWYRVEKMRFPGKGKEKDRSTVIYNSHITVSGIPDEAYEYKLGSRSGVEWVLDRYQVKIDKASQIKNDPNDWSREVEDPPYILDLLGRVVRVSVETIGIVSTLPPLRAAGGK